MLNYLASLAAITFASGDNNEQSSKRSRSAAPPAPVLIGSRALALYSDVAVRVPVPLYAREWLANDSASSSSPSSDWDVVAAVPHIVAAIDAVPDERLVVCEANVEHRRILLAVRDDANDGDLVRLDIEPIMSRAAFSLALADVPSSAFLIADYARAHGAELKRVAVPLFGECAAADVPLLFAIKRSHVHFPVTWRRHIELLHALLAAYPTRLAWHIADDSLARLCALRREELVALRGEPGAHIALNVTNEEFFADGGNAALAHRRRYDHDRIHEHVAYEPGVPIYTRLRRDPDKALLSEAAFRRLDHVGQVRLVKEECYAIALERYLLKGITDDAAEAYWMALERVCTTLARGWFREFACQHYPEAKVCDRDLVADAAAIAADARFLAQQAPLHQPAVLSPLAHVTPTHRVLQAPDACRPEIVNAIADILASWRQTEQSVTGNIVTTVVEFRLSPHGAVHRAKIVDKLQTAAFDKDADGSATLSVALDDAKVFSARVAKITVSHYEDSGCEWGGGGYTYYSQELVTKVDCEPLPAWFVAEADAVALPPLLAFAATIAVPVRAYEHRVVRSKLIARALDLPPFISVEKNPAHLYALQHPAQMINDALRCSALTAVNVAHLALYALPQTVAALSRCTALQQLTVVVPTTEKELTTLVGIVRGLPLLSVVNLQFSANRFFSSESCGVHHNVGELSREPATHLALDRIAAELKQANASIKRVAGF